MAKYKMKYYDRKTGEITSIADWFPKPTVAKPKKTISDVPDYEWQVRHEKSYDGGYDCDAFDWFSTFKKPLHIHPTFVIVVATD